VVNKPCAQSNRECNITANLRGILVKFVEKSEYKDIVIMGLYTYFLLRKSKYHGLFVKNLKKINAQLFENLYNRTCR
jgi:hypothetical protein